MYLCVHLSLIKKKKCKGTIQIKQNKFKSITVWTNLNGFELNDSRIPWRDSYMVDGVDYCWCHHPHRIMLCQNSSLLRDYVLDSCFVYQVQIIRMRAKETESWSDDDHLAVFMTKAICSGWECKTKHTYRQMTKWLSSVQNTNQMIIATFKLWENIRSRLTSDFSFVFCESSCWLCQH